MSLDSLLSILIGGAIVAVVGSLSLRKRSQRRLELLRDQQNLIAFLDGDSLEAGVEHFRFALFPEGEAMYAFNQDPARCLTTHFTSKAVARSGSAAAILQEFADHIHPDSRGAIEVYIRRHMLSCAQGLADGEIQDFQSDRFLGQNLQGGWTWYLIKSRLRRLSPELVVVEGVIVDVNDVITLLQELETRNTYTKSLLESLPSPVLSLNQKSLLQTANTAACDLFGQPAEHMHQKPIAILLGDRNNWLLEAIQEVQKSCQVKELREQQLQLGPRPGDRGNPQSATLHKTLTVNATVSPVINQQVEASAEIIITLDDITAEKRFENLVHCYLDPVIATTLARNDSDQLSGVESQATVMFADVRNFTSLAESIGPRQSVALLNQMFTMMVDCLQQEGGMLDKFIGDAIMAVFGLPSPADDDADRAVRSAIAMLRQQELFNARRANEGQPSVDIGIGLHTDVVVSGNIGSPKRMNYTVIGDGVNLAARLESACKFYGARLLISDSTAQRLRGTYRMREADRVVVKGKTEPVVIHELLDFHTDASFPNPMAVLNAYRDGLHLYRQQQWNGAIEAFQQAYALHPGDRLSALYIERAQQLQAQPPGPNWDGVWVMQDK